MKSRGLMAFLFLLLTSPLFADDVASIPPALAGITRFAFYGDSLTDGSDFPDYIVNTLNREFPGHGFTYVNAAVVGHRARDLVDRLDRDVLSQKPDLTFIFIGTNDHSNVPLVQYEAELRYLVHRLRAGGSEVAFITLTGNTDPEKAAKLRVYSDVIVKVASEMKTRLVDAWSFFEKEQKSGKQMYIEDGDSHHSLEGFRGMARVILTSLGIPASVPLELTITPPANLLTNWEESGPVTPPDRKTPVDPSMVTEWTKYDPASWVEERHWSIKPLTERGAWFALQGDAKNRAAFARTHFDAPAAGLYELQLGGGTTMRVWVNGVHVYTLPKVNGYHPNAVRSPVLLRKGRNEIIVTAGFYAFVGIEPVR